ncbi:GNAT family N-acetyltransferase [Gaoshiqia sp. Z1-71]|uniref:GNAT family N-acetyltransferase n=1 Tax=Gaoshiqia hydrogeniformans TaxID=3290090 RepID=UPI003BF8CC94
MNNDAFIRLASPDDAAEILEIYRPFIEGTAVTFEEEVPSPEEFKERIEHIRADAPCLVCEVNGRIVGYAYAALYRARASYRWNREVSVYIHPDYHRRNIARALYSALFEILRMQHITNLLAVITMPNEASVKLHESFGFRPCGLFNRVGYKLHQWHQVGWWELSFLEDEQQVPETPVPFSSFEKTYPLEGILQKASAIIKIS